MTQVQCDSGPKIRLGISHCLLGAPVRYDGKDKHDAYITGTLGRFFEFVPLCPEVVIGLGVPREPIRLEGDPRAPRAVGVRSKDLDVTADLLVLGRRSARQMGGISGYILKSGSPSCGLEGVKVYAGNRVSRRGVGLFVRGLRERQPLLPMEEEGGLADPELRENFIERVFAYRRWQELCGAGITPRRLVAFHSAHKLSLMAHGSEPARALGRLVAEAGRRPVKTLAAEYGAGFMAALGHRATRRRHTNVLQHLLGYLKTRIDAADKAEALELIDDYRHGKVPLIVPLTLLKHHLRRFPDPYLAGQAYLNPSPAELALCNAI